MTANEHELSVEHVVPHRLGLSGLRKQEGLWSRAATRLSDAFNTAFPKQPADDGATTPTGDDEDPWPARRSAHFDWD